MQSVLAALTFNKRGPRNAPDVSPPPIVVSAVKTLLNDPDRLITTMTVSQPVSSLEEGEAIGLAAGRFAFEHHVAVELSLSCSHVRVRLRRLTGQREAAGGQD